MSHSQFVTADSNRPIYISADLIIEGPTPRPNQTLEKLLLNSWSAEYALNITPIDDERFLESARNWTFPQAYYSVLFSARAVLLCNGNPDARECRITPAMTALGEEGIYERDFDSAEENPMVHLDQYRITTNKPAPALPADQTILEFHAGLCEYVSRAQMAHERYIFDCVGESAYLTIIYSLPGYLRESAWLSERVTWVLGKEVNCEV